MDILSKLISNSEDNTSEDVPSSSKCPQEDDAFSRLMSKDPVLGKVMKVMMAKLDETNRKLDSFRKEMQRDLGTCQDQINKLAVKVESVEEDKGTHLQKKPKDKGRPVAEDCICVPVVLRRILEHFSDKELIHLSLVNKLWNYEARSLLRDRGRLIATVSSTQLECLKLLQFASDLEKMRVVPFSGIHFDLSYPDDHGIACQPIPTGSMGPSLQVILDRLPWKQLHLSVGFYHELGECRDCPAVILISKILEGYYAGLEELSLFNVDREITEFVRFIIQHRKFPSLKVVKVKKGLTYSHFTYDFMKAMVSCAPNLEEFHVAARMEFTENVMEGSSGVLVPTSFFSPLYERVCEDLIPSLRTHSIDVSCQDDLDFDVELFNRVVPKILQASYKSLTSMLKDLLFALPLMCYGICLENVTMLRINTNDTNLGTIPERILELIKALDFTRVFPKLDKVGIKSAMKGRDVLPHEISRFIQRGDSVLKDALPDRATNIKHLELDEISPGSLIIPFLAQIFPHVKTLSIKTVGEVEEEQFSFPTLWDQFQYLEELNIDYFETDCNMPNLDSVFCGIFPEEVAELRTKDDDYLKAVNIVPVMPSIGCLRGLRLLTMKYDENDTIVGKSLTRMFSKVTPLVGFPRCPHLSVTFQRPSELPQALDHLKPYVTVDVYTESLDLEEEDF